MKVVKLNMTCGYIRYMFLNCLMIFFTKLHFERTFCFKLIKFKISKKKLIIQKYETKMCV